MDVIDQAKAYLAANAAESGADELIRALIGEALLWKDRYEAAEGAARATEHHCEELLREAGFFSTR